MSWTEREVKLRGQFARWARASVAPRAAACYGRGDFDRASWQELCELGFWRIALPARLGGQGGDWRSFAAALEGLALGAQDLGFVLSAVAHAGIVRALAEWGSAEQQEAHLPQLTGGSIAATAITEPQAGSDLSGIQTSAVAVGDGVLLNGQKRHVTNAPIANLLLVLGRMPELGDRHDITVFLVPADTPGVTLDEPEDMLGNRTSPSGGIRFDNVRLPRSAVLGAPGDGMNLIRKIIAIDRLSYGLLATGFIDWLLDESLDRIGVRRAFGRPIGDFEYVQGRVTEMKVLLEQARLVSQHGLEQLLTGGPEASLLCSLAKMVGTSALCKAAEHAMCIHGHVGYMDGPIARTVADSAGMRIAGGTEEVQRINIYRQLTRLHSDGARDGAAPPRSRTSDTSGTSGSGPLPAGIQGELVHEVLLEDTALRWGNELEVLATPVLLWLAEVTAMRSVAPHLHDGQMTLGLRHEVSHLAPTPRGASVRIRSVLESCDGRHLRFRVSADDGAGVVLDGTHDRVIVDRDQFVRRVRERFAGKEVARV